MKKIWSYDEIRNLLETSEKAILRAILVLHNLQTVEEQTTGKTLTHNGVGFNGIDAGILSSFARQIMVRGWLTVKQMEIAKKKILKYTGQLTKIANNEIVVAA